VLGAVGLKYLSDKISKDDGQAKLMQMKKAKHRKSNLSNERYVRETSQHELTYIPMIKNTRQMH
jgi:hypothetical protein